MNRDTEYNGWTNHETWLVNLWIDNEPYTNETIANITLDHLGSYERSSDYKLADRIKNQMVKDWFEDRTMATGLAVDLLNATLGRVNWQEIANDYLDELQIDDSVGA